MNFPTFGAGETILKEDLSFIEKWGRIQKTFSHVLGINFFLFAPSGRLVLPPAKVTPFCCEFSRLTDDPTPHLTDCVFKTVDQGSEHESDNLDCLHGAHYEIIKIGKSTPFLLVLGPFYLIRRPDERECLAVCRENNLDLDLFSDAVRNLKVYSFQRMKDVAELCQELGRDVG